MATCSGISPVPVRVSPETGPEDTSSEVEENPLETLKAKLNALDKDKKYDKQHFVKIAEEASNLAAKLLYAAPEELADLSITEEQAKTLTIGLYSVERTLFHLAHNAPNPSQIKIAEKTLKILRDALNALEHKTLEKGEKLGAGSFGDVHFLKHRTKDHTHHYAVKCSKSAKLEHQNEANILARLSQDPQANLLSLVAILSDPDPKKPFRIVVDCCNAGNLYEYVSKNALTLEQKSQIATDIAQGLRYLHDNLNIAHRDLKPENLLVVKEVVEGENVLQKVVIADYGLAEAPTQSTTVGTRSYWPYEVFKKFVKDPTMSFDGKAVDAWAYGAVLYELLTRYEVLGPDIYNGSQDVIKALNFLRAAKGEKCWNKFSRSLSISSIRDDPTGKKLRRVTLICLQKEPKDRLAMKAALEILAEAPATLT